MTDASTAQAQNTAGKVKHQSTEKHEDLPSHRRKQARTGVQKRSQVLSLETCETEMDRQRGDPSGAEQSENTEKFVRQHSGMQLDPTHKTT